MAATAEDVTLGVVGDGFGALQIYAAAIYLGFAPEQIGIFGEQTNPAHTYQQFAWNLGQTILRSESESHFLPADWPTFAEMDAWARRDPSPLLRSGLRKLNPGVPEILTQLQTVTQELGYADRVLGFTKVGWVVRELGPPAHFSLFDEDGELLGRAKHLAIATGHGPLSFPGVYGEARRDPATSGLVVQAYEPKVYEPDNTYIIVGSGIAAINEEVNVLEAGGKVLSLRRNPEPDDQDLNVPRCLFDGSGIDAFEALSFEKRLDFLGEVLKGTAPERATWSKEVAAAEKDGRYEERVGELTQIGPGPEGLRVALAPHDGDSVLNLDVSGVVLATGFVKDYAAQPLLRRLVQLYDVPTVRGRIRLLTNCGIPPLDRPDSRLCLMGLNGNTVVPNGDTISGLKYMARRYVGDVRRAEGMRRRSLPSRWAMQTRLAHQTSRRLRKVDKAKQLA